MSAHYDRDSQHLEALLPVGPRLAVIGSTDFYHHDSEQTCIEIGRLLATIPELTLLTGGVEGIGEAVGRSFFQERCRCGKEPRIFHILPHGEDTWDYGITYFAGSDMAERREVLGRLSKLYLVIEGGPGTRHEAEVATSRNAILVPIGRSGGVAADLFARLHRPAHIDESTWGELGSRKSTPEETANAASRAIRSCL